MLSDFRPEYQTDDQYNHMGATITDAMLQAGVKYETVVAPRVKRVRTQYPSAKTTSGFLGALRTVGPETVLNWKGTEKLNRVQDIATFFASECVETEADLRRWLERPGNIERLKSHRGVGDKTTDYFKILVGMSTSAVDRHLLNFLALARIPVSGYQEAQAIINGAADLLGRSRALFDHSIWKYMSTRATVAVAEKPCSQARPVSILRQAAGGEEEIEDEADVWEFRNNNPGYLRWLDEHPTGYVLNIGKRPEADDQVLHRASCGSARGAGRDWTGGMYMKVCATCKEALDNWAVRRVGEEPDRCRVCKP